ncbi:MAG: hypothetical protein F9K16_14680, partial [Thermoanaerobaculia bacterium]
MDTFSIRSPSRAISSIGPPAAPRGAPRPSSVAARRHPGRVAVGIDARGGRVAVSGWAEATDIPAVDLARRF